MQRDATMFDRVKFMHEGGKTKRFHTADTLTVQTVAEHSFGVAMLVALIAPHARQQVIMAALVHDLAEHQVGDVASPVKWANPDLKNKLQAMEDGLLIQHGFMYDDGLTNEESMIVKIADLMDGMLYCVRERKFGSDVRIIYGRFYSAVEQRLQELRIPATLFMVDQVFTAINQLWEEYNER